MLSRGSGGGKWIPVGVECAVTLYACEECKELGYECRAGMFALNENSGWDYGIRYMELCAVRTPWCRGQDAINRIKQVRSPRGAVRRGLLIFVARWIANVGLCLLVSFLSKNVLADSNSNPDRETQIHSLVWNSGAFYEGNFDDGTPLQMNLQFPVPRGLVEEDGFSFTSAYWDPTNLAQNKHGLGVSTTNKPNEFIAESINNAPSARIERFVGKWSKDRADADGTWRIGTLGHVRHFHLSMRFRYQTEFRSWMNADANQYGGRRSIAYTTYPLLGGNFPTAVPTLGLVTHPSIFSKVVKPESSSDTKIELLVEWASSRYLFLGESRWSYGLGASVGLGEKSFSHYEIQNGIYKPIDLGSFYDTHGRCVELLKRKLEDALVSGGASIPETGSSYLSAEVDAINGKNSERSGSIYLVTPAGIEFFFGSNSLDDATEYDIFVANKQLGNCADHFPHYRRK